MTTPTRDSSRICSYIICLFSSSLLQPRLDARDPLLPSHVSYDKSLCWELQKTDVGAEEARKVCAALCQASSNALARLEALRTLAAGQAERVCLVERGIDFGVMWGDACSTISGSHLE